MQVWLYFYFFQMPVLNASSSQGASAGATSSQGGASSRGKFEKKYVLKVS